MNLPPCPNVATGGCARSNLRVVGENSDAWFFHCATCLLCWTVSKPRTRDAARWQAQVDRTRRITDEERAVASRTKYFVMPGGSR